MKLKPKEKPHYVNNADFSQAVVEYCKTVIEHCILLSKDRRRIIP